MVSGNIILCTVSGVQCKVSSVYSIWWKYLVHIVYCMVTVSGVYIIWCTVSGANGIWCKSGVYRNWCIVFDVQ
jgi:hypothetical protein